MRRGRVLILLALILLLGAVAAFLVLSRLGGAAVTTTQAEPTPVFEAQIVVAAQDIPRGAEIPADAVVLVPYPADMVVETMVTDTNLVVGKRARMDIPRGVPVTENMLTEEPGRTVLTGSDAAIAIPPGMTAIAIPMDRLSGVAYAVRPGDFVDVLVTMLMIDLDPDFQSPLPNQTAMLVGQDGTLQGVVAGRNITIEPPNITLNDTEPVPLGKVETEDVTGQSVYVLPAEPQRPRLVTQRLIENAQVLHVGTFPLEGEAQQAAAVAPAVEGVGAQQQPGQEQQAAPEGPKPPDIVTLIVTPQDALALNWAMKAGVDIVLTLRAPRDTTTTETVSVTLQYLLDNYNIAVPSRLPFGLEPKLTAPIKPVLPNDQPQQTGQGQ